MQHLIDKKLKVMTLDQLKYWCKYSVWDIHQAVTLSLERDPEIFTLQDWETAKDINLPFIQKFKQRKKLLEHNMGNDNTLKLDGDVLVGYGALKGYKEFPDIVPLSFINWARVKKIELPTDMEKLVKEYNPDYIDWEARYKKLESKIEELETKNIKLTQEINSVPNAKRLTSWQKGFIGMLVIKYGYERLLANFGNICNKTKINDKINLTYAKIKDDLNCQGIILDDGTIKSLIEESIGYLRQSPKNNS